VPIYEYECSECGERFEIFVRGGEEEEMKCPECACENIERRLSTFAATTGAPDSGPC
jgi:putative FmdB family regulatory protein